jgi:hypothetical protein
VPPPAPGGISTEAVIARRNPGAVYKGLAIDTTGLVPLLFAADFSTGAIDVFDEEFQPVAHPGRFVDPALPKGYAPFNVADLGGELFVSYAKQDALKHDDAPGPGHGFIDVYRLDGVLSRRLVQRGDLNSPWGMVLATANFGPFSNDLLVGNFGDGKIHAYDRTTGAELGALTNSDGNQIQIDGLWGLLYGDMSAGTADTLFFTAGIAGESHGLLGSLTAQATQTTQTWNLVSDFATPPNQANPNPDSYGYPGVWSFREAGSLGHEDTYTLLPLFDPAHFGVTGLDVWHDTLNLDEPFVGLNASGADRHVYTFVWPAGTILVHPSPGPAVVVGWHSPVTRKVTFHFAATDIDANGGNGVRWSVYKNDALLFQQDIPNGGTAATSGTVRVSAGDDLYAIVDALNGDYFYDSTVLDLVISAVP